MEQVKHTPGPWEYGEERGLCREIHADNGPELYAIAQTRHGDPEICEANARLIAAAPELLEALEGLVGDIHGLIAESYGVEGLHQNGDIAPWEELEEGGRFERLSHLTAAITAIAKATGG